MGEVRYLFDRDKNREARRIDREAYLIQRVADIDTQIQLLESERRRLQTILGIEIVRRSTEGRDEV